MAVADIIGLHKFIGSHLGHFIEMDSYGTWVARVHGKRHGRSFRWKIIKNYDLGLRSLNNRHCESAPRFKISNTILHLLPRTSMLLYFILIILSVRRVVHVHRKVHYL